MGCGCERERVVVRSPARARGYIPGLLSDSTRPLSAHPFPMLTIEQTQAFDRDGFVLVLDVFSPREIEILLSHVTKDGKVTKHTGNMPDAAGRSSKLALWMDAEEDIFGAVSRSPRI